MKVRVLLTLLLFTTIKLAAQDLLPFVENFTKSDYNGDNQVWSSCQGDDNALYFANNHYFLRYNGVKWEKYSLPNKTIIRSIYPDGERVYSGSYREFGYWHRVEGKMEYVSLSKGKDVFTGGWDNEEIWKIFKHNDKLYFQSFNALYVSDGKTIERIKFPSLVSYCYVLGNTVYVASVQNGVYRMEGKQFVHLENWPELNLNVIHGMGLNQASGKIYVFTKNKGVFTGSENGITAWNSPLNNLLKQNVILCAKFIDDNRLAIGTALEGVYVVNVDTGEYYNINRQNTLKNNAVLSITLDKENDLWLGLDNGIAHIEVNSPISVFQDNSGVLGSVYSLSATGDYYLFATNHGLFEYKNNNLKAIPGSQDQVWDIYKNGDEYIIGHNGGTFVYNGGSFIKKSPINGGWRFIKSNYDNAYFQANYAGLAVYRDINNLSDYKRIDSLSKPLKNMAQNKPGEIWAADNYRGLYRITYDSDFNTIRFADISKENNINNDYAVKIFRFRDEILFYIDNTWYTYNSITSKLEQSAVFNASFKDISDVSAIDDNRFLVIKDRLLYLITREAERFVWQLLPEKYYEGKLIMEDTRVFKDVGKLLINLDDGFLTFNDAYTNKKSATVLLESFYNDKLIASGTKIKYNQPVEMNVVANYYGYSKPDLFYRLNNSGEYIPVKNGNIILSNLDSGSQDFKVYYNNGKEYIETASFDFVVARPWYFSGLMILVYILVISIVFFLYYRWNKVRYLQKIRLHEEELKHQKEILEVEMDAENKLRQQEHEKHMLETEVQNKASEVAGKSLSIAKHSEMIESIQEVLESKAEGDDLKSKIRKIIKTSSLSKNEWQSFEKNLFKSHEEFVDKLSQLYPSLTPKDIKLSIYLKMNLSSKEIAPLMNISYRGVELHRYRLRKKLDIDKEESLYRFMINL
ncbi:helix-turn-helix and ligand-binding sensor domain-containing protein [Flavobacterium sp. C4GT6]|uniref:helix-turn-helix and ligand-binding sensor domain-containing protein n=1 Tax=Flavobacterium sp. C4GT6 TaxID=3103818 RepID=UPI002ED1A641